MALLGEATDPGCDADDDDDDDEQNDEEHSETEQCHVLWRKCQELVEIRPLCTVPTYSHYAYMAAVTLRVQRMHACVAKSVLW